MPVVWNTNSSGIVIMDVEFIETLRKMFVIFLGLFNTVIACMFLFNKNHVLNRELLGLGITYLAISVGLLLYGLCIM